MSTLNDPGYIAFNNEFISYFKTLNKKTYIPLNKTNTNLENTENPDYPPFYIQKNIGGYYTISGIAKVNNGLDVSDGLQIINLSGIIDGNLYQPNYTCFVSDDVYYSVGFFVQSGIPQIKILSNIVSVSEDSTISLSLNIYPKYVRTEDTPVDYRILRENFNTRNDDFIQWESQFQLYPITQYVNTDYCDPDASAVYYMPTPYGGYNVFGVLSIPEQVTGGSYTLLMQSIPISTKITTDYAQLGVSIASDDSYFSLPLDLYNQEYYDLGNGMDLYLWQGFTLPANSNLYLNHQIY